VNIVGNSLAVWYLMRASGVVSLVLLTAVFALGIATTNRWRPARLPRFVTVGLHRNISLLSVVFLAIHVATAVVDPYAHVGIVATVIPFTAGSNAFWVGLGAVSLDLVTALIVSSLLRRHIGQRVWKTIHWLAYASWPVAFAHTLGSGTDSTTLWLRIVSGLSAAIIGAAIVWRLRGVGGPAKHLEPRSLPTYAADAYPGRRIERVAA
jgi:methionine sulfoxide reductase heme-binding subunit